ncbi:MAG: leucyl aminopeptidase [Planctomycetes bacterium]|nr:leucyl aminopeptidase [Planctomycetota bacterium]
MKCTVSRSALGALRAPALTVFVYEKSGPTAQNGQKSVATALRGLSETAAADGFRARAGDLFTLHQRGGKIADRILFAGLGSPKSVKLDDLRVAAAKAARQAEKLQQKHLALALPAVEGESAAAVAQAVTEGVILGTYRFRRYKTSAEERARLATVELVPADPADGRAVRGALSRAQALGEAVCFARDLVNEPAEHTTPTRLAEQAKSFAGRDGYTVTIHDKEDLERLGMGGILGVSRGSDQPPVFIEMRYTPPEKPSKTVALVGKGVTFDSGGLNLKNADGMLTMKDDMSGAANILGIFHALGKLKPTCAVIGLIPSAENMPSGKAYRPGDVLHMYSGSTVEVNNTDAEGRLLLADGLWYGHEQHPDEMIDMATLTGAARQALGDEISAVLGTDQALIDRLLAQTRRSGESLWQLPLEERYWDDFKSGVADMLNTGKAGGGTIKAALFLKRYVGDTPWAHLDIASTAFREKAKGYQAGGATGVMVRTILEYLAPGVSS